MREGNEAHRWLEQAEDDLRWAAHLAEHGAYNIACFLSQQVAEKALKAVLFSLGEELVTSHSVRTLCERAAARLSTLTDDCSHWGSLDTYYISTRYPDALPGSIPAKVFDAAAATGAVQKAKEVAEAARRVVMP